VLLTPRSDDDHAFAGLLGHVLRAGVLTAALIVAAGAAVYLVHRGEVVPAYQVFNGEPDELRSVRGILAQAARGSGRGLIQLGLLVLIATPIARVAFSVVMFVREQDRTYIAVSLVVLALLAYSLFVA
jgi:uncharacterized membrane protein